MRSLFRNLLRRTRRERDLDDEVNACIDLLMEESKAAGLPEEEARLAAYRRFGGPEQVKDAVRDVRAGEQFQRCWQDLRYAARTLRKSRGFSIAAIAILSLGIGANSAMFSIVDAVLLKPLPYKDPRQLVQIRQNEPRMSEMGLGTAPPEFVSYRDRTRVFSSVAGYQTASYDVTGLPEPDHVPASKITASLFDTLQLRPYIGRAFSRADEAGNAERVVLISYSYWARHYGADPAVLNKIIHLDELPYRIIGVMPRGFVFPSSDISPGAPPALWLPLSFSEKDLKAWASSFDTSVIARLRPGMTLHQAQEDVSRVVTLFQKENPDAYAGNTVLEASVEPWKSEFNSRIPTLLRAFSFAVGVVLLIACANVGNLLLARMTVRQREISIRRALGASNFRLARQVLSETAILAVCAALLGTGFAIAGLRLVEVLWGTSLNFRGIAVNGQVLLFTVGLSCAACFLCGVVPAIAGLRPDIHSTLRQAGQQSATHSGRRLASIALGAEVAGSMVLLVTASLLTASFNRVLNVPLGFDPENVLLVRSNFNGERYASHRKRREIEREILSRLGAYPQVEAAALTTHVPLADGRQIGFRVEGAPENDFHWADNAIVTGNYFSAMGTRLLSGRTFSDRDTPQSVKVALINDSMARRYWRHSDPIGKVFYWAGRRFEVIGVVQDVHVTAIDQPVGPAVYFDAFQMENHVLSSAVFILRTSTELNISAESAQVRKSIWSIDPALPILEITTLHEVVSSSLATRRAALVIAAGFALLACLLAVAGIYSVFSQNVTQRVREIGVRLALGAQPAAIRNEILRQGIRLITYSSIVGLLLSLSSVRLLSTILFGVRASDPVPYLTSALGLLGVALLGLYAPARRASRVDPLLALRSE